MTFTYWQYTWGDSESCMYNGVSCTHVYWGKFWIRRNIQPSGIGCAFVSKTETEKRSICVVGSRIILRLISQYFTRLQRLIILNLFILKKIVFSFQIFQDYLVSVCFIHVARPIQKEIFLCDKFFSSRILHVLFAKKLFLVKCSNIP